MDWDIIGTIIITALTVNRLEVLLTESASEKDDLRMCVLKLTEEVATLRERVKFLEAENERLKLK